jgi:hypothetical protein
MQWFLRPDLSGAAHILFGLRGTVLVFDLPVCFFILIGHPPVLTLALLLPSKEEREFHRALRLRPRLSNDEFFARFYAGTGSFFLASVPGPDSTMYDVHVRRRSG